MARCCEQWRKPWALRPGALGWRRSRIGLTQAAGGEGNLVEPATHVPFLRERIVEAIHRASAALEPAEISLYTVARALGEYVPRPVPQGDAPEDETLRQIFRRTDREVRSVLQGTSLEDLASAPVEQIAAVPGMTMRAAQSVKTFLSEREARAAPIA